MLKKIIFKIKRKLDFFFENTLFNNQRLDRKLKKKQSNKKFQNGNNYWNKVAQNIEKQSSTKNEKTFFLSSSVTLHLAPPEYILGYKLLKKIKKHVIGEQLLNKCSTPPWGSPFILRMYPFISPQTAIHLINIISFYDCFGKKFLYYKSIIDFGGGYGGLARCLCQFANNYIIQIIDLPKMLKVQKKYLSRTSNFDDRIKFTNDIVNLKGKYDLFNASFSFSEIPENKRLDIENFIITKCDRFHIIYQSTFNDVDNIKFMDNFAKKFRSKKWKVFVKPYDYHGSDAKYVMYGTSPKI